jgi:GTP cyclohydrolase II
VGTITSVRTNESRAKGVVYTHESKGRGIGLINKCEHISLQEDGLDTVEANLEVGSFNMDEEDYGVRLRFLRDWALQNGN